VQEDHDHRADRTGSLRLAAPSHDGVVAVAARLPYRLIVVVLVTSLLASAAGVGLLVRIEMMPPVGSPFIFSDEFQEPELDTGKWATCYPWFKGSGCTNQGNNELEWYLPDQVNVGDGVLHLTATRGQVTGFDARGRARRFPFTSGMVTTAGHFEFTYGRVEFEARAPRGRGMWPALWLLPADGSPRPEIDVMEAYGEDTWQVFLSYHAQHGGVAQQIAFVNDISAGWHIYALDWSRGSLIWYLDGRRWFTVNQNVPTKPMYLVANLAVSGMPPHQPDGSTPDQAQFDIASVRVWGSA
jgi:beta-glucanase (GH16 family)